MSRSRGVQDGLRVRRAAVLDDPRLAAIAYDVWSPAVSNVPLWAADRPFFRVGSDTQVQNTLVAFTPETVAGYVAVLPGADGGREWMVSALAVDRFHQRRGIGTALLRAAISATGSGGAVSLRTTVAESNTAGLRLFAQLGFTALSEPMGDAAEGSPRGPQVLMRRWSLPARR